MIHFDCKRLQSILTALKDQNASSTVNSTTSGHFDLPPWQNRFRSVSPEKQSLEAPFISEEFRGDMACLQTRLLPHYLAPYPNSGPHRIRHQVALGLWVRNTS
jgi:hypothetical protein